MTSMLGAFCAKARVDRVHAVMTGSVAVTADWDRIGSMQLKMQEEAADIPALSVCTWDAALDVVFTCHHKAHFSSVRAHIGSSKT